MKNTKTNETLLQELELVKQGIPDINKNLMYDGVGKHLQFDSVKGNINQLRGMFAFSVIMEGADGSYDYILLQDGKKLKDCTDVTYAKQEHLLKLHKHDYYEMVYVAQGELHQLIEGNEVKMQTGDFLLMDCNACHMELFEGKEDVTVCYLCLPKHWILQIIQYLSGQNEKVDEFYKEFISTVQNKKKGCLLFSKKGRQSEAERLLSDIVREMLFHEAGYESIVKGYLIRLFHFLIQPEVSETDFLVYKIQKDMRLAEKIISYLKENKRRVTRAELSEVFHYQEDYMSRIVKKYTGISLKKYMNYLLLEEAERLLSETEESVNQIMKKLEFENETHFYKIFYEKNQMTPIEYREKVGK